MTRFAAWFRDTRLGLLLRPAFLVCGDQRYRVRHIRGTTITLAGGAFIDAGEMLTIKR